MLPQGYDKQYMWKMLTSVKSEVHWATERRKARLWGKSEVLTDWKFSVQTHVSTWKCLRSSSRALGHVGSPRRRHWMQSSLEGNVRWLCATWVQALKRKVTDKVDLSSETLYQTKSQIGSPRGRLQTDWCPRSQSLDLTASQFVIHCNTACTTHSTVRMMQGLPLKPFNGNLI